MNVLNLAACSFRAARPLRRRGGAGVGCTPVPTVLCTQQRGVVTDMRDAQQAELKLHTRFHNRDPHVVMGVEKGTAKAKIKKAYYALAREYHPDNVKTGNQQIMNQINAAYAKLTSGEEMMEAVEETEEPKTSTQRREAHNMEGKRYRHATDDQKEEEERRNAERERIRVRAKARSRRRRDRSRLSDAWSNPRSGALVHRCRQRTDGSWIYEIRGRFYTAEHYIAPLFLNATLLRGNFSDETFESLLLTPMEIGDDHAAYTILTLEERVYMQRSIPLLFNSEGDATADDGKRPHGVARRMWRDTYILEMTLVASLVSCILYSISCYVMSIYTLTSEFASAPHGEMLYKVATTRRNRAAQNADVDSALEELDNRLKQLEEARIDLNNMGRLMARDEGESGGGG